MGGSTPLQAWVENNAVNTAPSTYVWVNLPSGLGAAGSGSQLDHDLHELHVNPVMSAPGPTGEAPQLSAIVRAVRPAMSVFNIYGAFQGSSLPSGWTAGYTVGSYTPSFIGGLSTAGGVEMMNNVGYQSTYLEYNPSFTTQNTVIETSWGTVATAGADDLGIGTYASSIEAAGDGIRRPAAGGYFAGYEFYSGGISTLQYNGAVIYTASSQTLPSSGTNYFLSQTTITPTSEVASYITSTAGIYYPVYSGFTTPISYSGAISNANPPYFMWVHQRGSRIKHLSILD